MALPEDDRREPVDGRLKPRAIPAKWHEFIVQHAQGDAVFRSKTFKGLKIPLGELWSVLPKR